MAEEVRKDPKISIHTPIQGVTRIINTKIKLSATQSVFPYPINAFYHINVRFSILSYTCNKCSYQFPAI